MTTITTRAAKGSPLSWVEADTNFTNLNIDKQEHSTNLDLFSTVTPTAAGIALLDDSTAGDQRTTLGLGNVDNTSDSTKNSAVATLTNKTLTTPTINTNINFSGSSGAIQVGGVDALSIDATTNTISAVGAFSLAGVPAGTLIDFAGAAAPAGFLACPLVATNISRVTYAALFAAIGTTWGAGDGSTTFGMPYFPADYAAVQGNANVGTSHVGQVISHSHLAKASITGFTGGSASLQYAAGDNNGTANVATQANNGVQGTGGAANLAAGVRVLKCVKI